MDLRQPEHRDRDFARKFLLAPDLLRSTDIYNSRVDAIIKSRQVLIDQILTEQDSLDAMNRSALLAQNNSSGLS
jgi:hypothetical protein